MTLRSLEIFCAVAKLGKMNEASHALHITQPTVSQTIAELEREFDVMLFHRLSKKLYITEAGRQLYEYARNILSLTEDMKKNMKNLSSHQTILFGATMTVGSCILADLIQQFEIAYPNITVVVTVDNTSVMERMLLDSSIDLACIEGMMKSSELIAKPMVPDELVLVCSKDHPFFSRKAVSIYELPSYPFILRESGSGTREIFENRLREYNLSVPVKWTCHGSDSILEAVFANQGLTVISKKLVEPHLHCEKLAIVPIENILMKRDFSLVYHKSKYFTKPMKTLLSFLTDFRKSKNN